MTEFLNYKLKNNLTEFEIKSEPKNPIDKSIINGLRRTILTEIPTVGIEQENIVIEDNQTSLHNEFMKHRISMIPLSINPDEYNNDYIFVLDIDNKSDLPKTITTEDFKIFKLKSELVGKDIESNDKSNYNFDSEISKKEKKKILRPYEIDDIISYIIITELKGKTSDDDYQSIKLYLFPSVGIGKTNSLFNNIPQCSYCFKENEKLLENAIDNQLKINDFKTKKENQNFRDDFINKYKQRYYYRNNQNEPYWYQFKIKSNHYYKSKQIFLNSLLILIDQLNRSINNFKLITIDPDKSRYTASIQKNKTVKFIMDQENDTIGNIIQSHIVNNITDDSFITVCGYKKVHPLEEKIQLLVHTKIIDDIDSISIVNKTIVSIVENIDEIINILQDMIKSFDSL